MLVQNQEELAPVSTPVATLVIEIAERIREDLAQGATSKTDSLSATWRLVSIAEEQTIFVTKGEIESLFQQEKDKLSFTATFLRVR